MQIIINQKPYDIPKQMTLNEIPTIIHAKPPFAIAVNKVFVPKNQYQETIVCENDVIEIISPITGG
jgi:sulfur carrier protein